MGTVLVVVFTVIGEAAAAVSIVLLQHHLVLLPFYTTFIKLLMFLFYKTLAGRLLFSSAFQACTLKPNIGRESVAELQALVLPMLLLLQLMHTSSNATGRGQCQNHTNMSDLLNVLGLTLTLHTI